MKKLILVTLSFVLAIGLNAQNKTEQDTSGYGFKVIKEVPTTSVKDQYRSGTCWSFSGYSFVESEMLRMGKPKVDLSEMWAVRYVYSDKVKRDVRMHGKFNFGGGGALNDPIDVIQKYGIVPESAYPGLNYGTKKHVHGEMDEVLAKYAEGVIENKNRKLTTAWHAGFDGILDAYLGKVPKKFQYNGKDYTPKTFAKEVVGINPDDYVYLTSYTHHPFYKQFILEVQDNWSWHKFYNVKMTELTDIMDYAINNGYSIGWAADVSERGFSWRKGVAVVPETDVAELSGMEKDKWEKMDKKERNKRMFSFDGPVPEKKVTQKMRQEAFDNYQTTDDHGMHIVGIAKDKNGTEYYKVKNSWNTENIYKGYFYASKTYVQYKTMSMVVHKDAIPKKIRKELGIK